MKTRAAAFAVRVRPCVLALALVACSGPSDSSPESAFKSFVSALQAAREEPGQAKRVVELLSSADRRELQRRADATRRLGGEAPSLTDLLVLERMEVAWTPKKVKVAKRSGRRAEVVATGPDKQRARVTMVEEDDGWRVSLGLDRARSGR